MNRSTLFILFLLLIGRSWLPAGVGVNVRYDSYYSDNIFFNASGVSDYVSALSLSLDYNEKNISLFTDLSASLFRENGDFNSFKIEPGIEYLKYLEGRNYIYATAGFSALAYRELFTDFNYTGPFAELGVKYYLGASFLLKGQYSFEQRNYSNFSSFDFLNHTFYVEVNKFLESSTTLRMRFGINYRYYPHIASITEAQTGGAILLQGPGGGKGPGPNEPDPVPEPAEITLKVPNVFATLRIAQGFGPNFGLVGEVELRKNFQGLEDAGALIESSYVIYPYNDDYLWDGRRFSFFLNAIPFGDIVFNASLSFYAKDYPGIYVMDEEGYVVEPLEERKDTMVQASFKVSKRFKQFSLYLAFVTRDNRSNDFYFDYDLWNFSLGVGYVF
jgi:hypothetical protein